MYPPLFDVPVRRVKPLPKRRRTQLAFHPDADYSLPVMHPQSELPPQFPIPPALPPYYLPIFNGVQDMFAEPRSSQPSLDFSIPFAALAASGADDDHGDGDYVDHLQHPGNTKKRKVPAAHHFPSSSPDPPNATSVDDDINERATMLLAGRGVTDHEPPDPAFPPPSVASPARRKTRGSRVTSAGLQHKEMLKSRKRQLAAVLGAISHGDTLALDQALSARYPQLNRGVLSGDPKAMEATPPLRPSRRANRRAARLHVTSNINSMVKFPTCEFTFVCHSATTDRLITTREEVAVLHARFEAELARQAAKAAEAAAKQSTALGPESIKRTERRSAQRSRTAGSGINLSGTIDQPVLATKTRVPKKKKRSALANASNPHHLRNYVPSRIPHSGQTPAVTGQATINPANSLGPLPIRFLTAEIAPRRRKKAAGETLPIPPLPQLTAPTEEWICAFCEYNLFYGSESGFRRGVRSRKKILRRRRRARERAAAAASGNAALLDKGASTVEDSNSEMETGMPLGKLGQGVPVGKRERDKGYGGIGTGSEYGNLPDR